jgi:aarF domain-containing kinase
MPYSVCKGVSATALLACVDQGALDLDSPVSLLWPEFCSAQSQSYRAHEIAWKRIMSVKCAITHRGALHAAEPSLTSLVNAIVRKDPDSVFRLGVKSVESAHPLWQPDTRAQYHRVTWGFIVGGIVEKACHKHISDVVKDEIANKLRVENEMYLGRLPEQVYKRNVCRLEWTWENFKHQ